MKCKKCGFEGRGSRGFYTSTEKGEHWKCPVCRELTKLSTAKRRPVIKGTCNACKASFISGSELRCHERIYALNPHGYCEQWEARK